MAKDEENGGKESAGAPARVKATTPGASNRCAVAGARELLTVDNTSRRRSADVNLPKDGTDISCGSAAVSLRAPGRLTSALRAISDP